jgi:hypothetical protein
MNFQEFGKDTIVGRYIKSLLNQTPVPLYEGVIEGNYIIEGCYYVHNSNIIKCSTSGILGTDGEYDVVCSLNTADKRLFSTFLSNTNVYDSETHYYLGRYLRYLRSSSGLNLQPYYNCYTGSEILNVSLKKGTNSVTVRKTNRNDYKVIAIPVIIGKKYTISIDCDQTLMMRPALITSNGLVQETADMNNYLSSQGRVLSSASILSNPFLFEFSYSCDNKLLKSLYNLHRSLNLLIQLPIRCSSSVVVFEDYVPVIPSTINYEQFDSSSPLYIEKKLNFTGVLSPSLISGNHLSNNYAFSPRLVEYLTGNVIHPGTPNHKDIEKIQNAFCIHNKQYRDMFSKRKEYIKGLWDPMLHFLIYDLVIQDVKDRNIFDQDGNVNKDVERLLRKKGILY